MPLCSVSGIFLFQSNLFSMFFHFFHVICGRPRPLFPTASKSNALLNTSSLSLLKTCPYHRTPLPNPGQSIQSIFQTQHSSSWLLFSINLNSTRCYYHCFSSFQNYHLIPQTPVSLPYSIAVLIQLIILPVIFNENFLV